MIARIIPSMRAPRGVDAFDYAIPEGMDVRAGDVVKIPFRKQIIAGLVRETGTRPSEGTAFANAGTEGARGLKEIAGSYGSLRFSADTIAVLKALAAHSFSSQASVLRAWLGSLPKRERDGHDAPKPRQSSLCGHHDHFLMPNHVHGVIGESKELVRSGAKILVLTPWASRAGWIADQLGAEALNSGKAAGARYRMWSSFVRRECSCLVATRLGAWLSAEADAVIVDEPENDDHKQDELSPRYDARRIAEAAAEMSGRSLIKIGLTPPLDSFVPSAQKIEIPALDPRMIPVDVHRADWSDAAGLQGRTLMELERAVREKRPAFVIHPIHGERARLRCADCSWQANCSRCGAGLNVKAGKLVCLRCNHEEDIALACPVCGGTNLSKSRAGKDRLADDLRKKGMEGVRALSIGEWNALNRLPNNGMVILTDLSLFAGGAEDLRKKERLIIAFRRLADMCETSGSSLAVQSDAGLLAEAKTWLTAEGCENALKNELKERGLFRLPPAFRLLKIIFRGNEGFAKRQMNVIGERIRSDSSFALSGPFPVLYRPFSRTQRWIAHLSAPSGAKTEAFERAIEPLLKTNAIFDLDPIAFFE
jgi:primosomal protein N'